jgi:hypothetical protein
MASLDHLNRLLTKAAHLLDQAAGDFAELGLRPERNIREVGKILVAIYDLQKELHKKRPSLIPAYLRGTKYARKITQAAAHRKATRKVAAPAKRTAKPRASKE